MKPKLPKKINNKQISLQLQSNHYKITNKAGKATGVNIVS